MAVLWFWTLLVIHGFHITWNKYIQQDQICIWWMWNKNLNGWPCVCSIWELYDKVKCPTITNSIGAVAGSRVVAAIRSSAAGSSVWNWAAAATQACAVTGHWSETFWWLAAARGCGRGRCSTLCNGTLWTFNVTPNTKERLRVNQVCSNNWY